MIDIAALRKKLGMSAVELAAAIDVTPGFISQVENGKSGVSTATAVQKVPRYLPPPNSPAPLAAPSTSCWEKRRTRVNKQTPDEFTQALLK